MVEIINAIHEQAGHTDMALSGLLYSKVIHLFCYNALDIIFVVYHIMSGRTFKTDQSLSLQFLRSQEIAVVHHVLKRP